MIRGYCALLVACGGLACSGAEQGQARFALYLVKAHHAEITKTELESEPLLTEKDIASYDWQTHTMTLTESGEKRIPDAKRYEPLRREFVMVADGQRCYRGAFWSSALSYGNPNPIIDLTYWGHTVQIQRAYPKPGGTGDDPRSDKRIRHVLQALGKLRHAEQKKECRERGGEITAGSGIQE